MGAKDVVIVGAGNQGALLLDCLAGDDRWRPTAFLDDGKAGQTLRGLPIRPIDAVGHGAAAFLAFGYPDLRRSMADRLSGYDVDWQTFVDRRSILGADAGVGRGTLVLGHAFLASGTQLGPFCYIGAFSRVGAGATVGAFTSVMTGSTVADSTVGQGCVLGLNCTCTDGAQLGDGVTVAPYTLVRRPVPDGALVAGSPARVFRRPVQWVPFLS